MLLTEYLDKDGDSRVSFQEFSQKITLKDYQLRSYKYRISLKNFTDRVKEIWYVIQAEERKKLQVRIEEFDQDADSYIQFNEFQTLMTKIEPNCPSKLVLQLFKKTCSK